MRIYPHWDILHGSDYDAVVPTLLRVRGTEPEELDVGAEVLNAPELLADMDAAVGRLEQAIRAGERIVIYGDYDVDGVTSTALLLDFLQHVGADVVALLPDRYADGYGLRPAGVERAADMGGRLIVTVDNGISAFEALELAAVRGLDVVVVDHHQQLGPLPRATAIVDPNRVDCTYPFDGLAGVGVVFKVVQALSSRFLQGRDRRAYLNGLLDLVALGTVADIMPVTGENRLFIQRGLQVLNRTVRPGLRQLLMIAGFGGRPVDAHGIAFRLGPRLNVAGRLDKPDLALRLLCAKDDTEAAVLADHLHRLNGRRQELQRAGLAEAEALIAPRDLVMDRIVILLGDTWHLGVIGLLASRLAEKHARPAVVCSAGRRDGTYTGSARSIPAYDISAGISACADLLDSYGGHPGAAGFSLAEDTFEAFRVRLLEHAQQHLAEHDLQARLSVDLMLKPLDISVVTLGELHGLQPFGPGNPTPVFGTRACRVRRARTIGRSGEHLKVELRCGELSRSAVWWNKGNAAAALQAGTRVDLAFTLQPDTYSDVDAVQLDIQDMFLS